MTQIANGSHCRAVSVRPLEGQSQVTQTQITTTNSDPHANRRCIKWDFIYNNANSCIDDVPAVNGVPNKEKRTTDILTSTAALYLVCRDGSEGATEKIPKAMSSALTRRTSSKTAFEGDICRHLHPEINLLSMISLSFKHRHVVNWVESLR